MPQMPQVGERRTANGETREWTGDGWIPVFGEGSAISPMLPPMTPSGRTDAQDLSALKTILNVGGSTLAALAAPQTIPARLAFAALGGMAGRTAGHGIEVANKAARRDTSEGPSLSEDALTGATEGMMAEASPYVIGGVLKFGGKPLRVVGDALSNFTGSGHLGHTVGAASRYYMGHSIAGVPGGIAAAVGPPVMSAVGRGAEKVGDAMLGRTLSQHAEQALKSLRHQPINLIRETEPPMWGPGAPTGTASPTTIRHLEQLPPDWPDMPELNLAHEVTESGRVVPRDYKSYMQEPSLAGREFDLEPAMVAPQEPLASSPLPASWKPFEDTFLNASPSREAELLKKFGGRPSLGSLRRP